MRQNLRLNAQPVDNILRHAERRIDRLESGMAQQREAANAEERVEYVWHVAGAIREAARLRVLTGENELLQLLGANPMQPPHNGQR